MKEGTCECTDSWHGHKEPSIRPTRDGENNLTRQLHFEKKVKYQFNSCTVTIHNNVQLKKTPKKKRINLFFSCFAI
jgi:hypothetical protein